MFQHWTTELKPLGHCPLDAARVVLVEKNAAAGLEVEARHESFANVDHQCRLRVRSGCM